MATIKPIEAKAVIVDLCSVVKELVENGIDAGATNIEVRFKNQGLDAIEVQDNGSGISKENYATLALKHYTSKLSTYSDLECLETFGFRGEALSSLCALSKFSVTTCLASDAPKGSRLEFETSGKLRNTSVVAAQKGTTVVPNKGKRMVLFSTKGNQTTRENIVNVFGAKTLAVLIPLDLELELEPTTTSTQRLTSRGDSQAKLIRVRGHVSRPAYGEGRQTPDRQMFFVNGRPCGLPQFAKVFNEVYKSYNASQSPFIFADIQLDTHLYDVNVSPDKRTILLHDQTRMLDNLRESLSALFESQDYALPTAQLQTPKQTLLKRPSLSRQDTPSSEATTSIDAVSFIAPNLTDAESGSEGETVKMNHNDGAQSAHGSNLISRWAARNCDIRADTGVKDNKVMKSIDEEGPVQREDTRSPPSPGVEQEQSPPNEDPTKVSDRVADFRARLEELKDGKTNATTDKSTLPESALSEPPIPALSPLPRITDINSNKVYSSSTAKRRAPEVATITIGDHTVTSIIGSTPKKQRLDSQQHRNLPTRKGTKASVPVPSFNGRLTQMFAAQAERSLSDERKIKVTAEAEDDAQDSDSSSEHLFVSDDSGGESDNEGMDDIPSRGGDQKYSSPQASQASEANPDDNSEAEPTSPVDRSDAEYKDGEAEETKEESGACKSIENSKAPEEMISEESQKRTQSFIKGNTKRKDATYHLQQNLRVDGKLVRDALTLQQEHISRSFTSTRAMLETDRLDAEDAEEKLSLTISKSDFEKMKIIGQFNLGFILASRAAEESSIDRLDRSDRDDELFIIDQHATDEKYNFERLQASTVVQSQRLVHPKMLELTAVEEDIVQQNLDALETNGFMVSFDESGDQPVGTRCQLLSLPLSRETTFSLADLEELISLLQDHQSTSANTVPRPSKVRKMFAMRACRSSVMIGKSLSTKQMEKLVRHMGELDKPWNCPHGRPTMRHLCGLGAWDELGWKEGDGFDGTRASRTDWSAYLDEGRDLE
ncbi:hypothetical protein CHU98_g7666 [Xylaria longipes]|nr:hypothetical protein CHU98_g7666 [Xylaria longipes]